MDNPKKSEKELQLEQILRALEKKPELPEQFQPEPGAFLHLVKEAWGGEIGRDGRRGFLSEEKLAGKIQERVNHPYTRNQWQTMFGGGRRAYRTIWKQAIPRDVAKGFLEIAFAYWSVGPNGSSRPFVTSPSINIAQAIENACEAMFGSGPAVVCRSVLEPGGIDKNENLCPLLKKLVEDNNQPISLQDIEFSMEMRFHRMKNISAPMLQQMLMHRRITSAK